MVQLWRQDLVDKVIGYKRNHTLLWGKMYRSCQVKPTWRKPSEADIDMAFDILGLANERVDKLDSLLENRALGDKVWSNEFCRALSALDKVLRGSYNLLMEIESTKTGGVPAER